MKLINAWKTVGALERPKGMTKYSKCSKGILNIIPLITVPYMDKMISVAQVEKRVAVLYSDVIKTSVVDARP